MKRTITLLVIAAFVCLALAACGGNDMDKNEPTSTPTASPSMMPETQDGVVDDKDGIIEEDDGTSTSEEMPKISVAPGTDPMPSATAAQ